ncbi:MAG: UbiA family prenyltransferase, partial [Gammaproteobacteria bacterium]|nr:UbiA family prenyltransferase [Gammaproteobacteria bacterium]
GEVVIPIAYLQWLSLGFLGLLIAWFVNPSFFICSLIFWIMGVLYNAPPIRLKDTPYIDVLSESINNPIRLMLGWFTVNEIHLPTLSLVLAYWMIGAFFMAVKRYAEYKKLHPDRAARYRKSFAHYDEYRLIASIIYYAAAFSLFFGIFMVRYRLELILSVPLIAGFVSLYMKLGFLDDSPVQYPEHLYKQKRFVIYTTLCLITVLTLLFIDIPLLHQLFRPRHMPGS